MILSLVKNQLKEAIRSSFRKHSIAANIFMVIVYGLVSLNFLAVGLTIQTILNDLAPGEDHIKLFNGFVLLYFLTELLIRFFVQKVHGFRVIPYLHLPVKRSLIKNYLLVKPFWSPFNFTPFLTVLPFAVMVLTKSYSASDIFCWLGFIFFFIQMINYLNLLVNRLALIRSVISIVFVVLLLFLLSAEALEFFSLREFSAAFFTLPLENHFAIFIPFGGAILFYGLNYILLENRFYLDDLKVKAGKGLARFTNIDFSSRFGELGSYISLELKLLLRNKRPASTLLFGFPVLLYGFLAYGTETYKDSYYMNIYWGVFLVSMFMIFYGQFIFGWESSYFDAVLGKNINIRKYIQAKFYLLAAFCTVSFLFTLPYGFFDANIWLINTNVYLFSIGVSSYAMIFMGTYARKRIDIQAGLMSMQGKGAMQFVFIIPLLVAPILLALPINLFYGEFASSLFLGFLGLAGLILNKTIMDFLYRQFITQKYKMAEAFREAE
ncbi:MAG: DUF5687 family protein [Rhodothermaceae bacterium]